MCLQTHGTQPTNCRKPKEIDGQIGVTSRQSPNILQDEASWRFAYPELQFR